MVHMKLDKKQLLGSYDWQGNMDMVNIVMIGLAKEPAGNAENHGLHRLLGVLLSDTHILVASVQFLFIQILYV